MPREMIMSRRAGWLERIPPVWRVPLVQLAAAWLALVLLTRRDWAEMAWQWWNDSTCNHILLIPLILVWLVRLRSSEVVKLSPQAWWPGLVGFAAGLLAWALGTAASVNLLAELGAVMLLQASVAILFGPRIVAGLIFPLAYMLFLVPFGDEIVPPLQMITARMAVALTHVSGVPASISGVFIDTPVGRFEVAAACSGVKFLVAMIALGTLVAHLFFRRRMRRAAFMVACVVVPVLANGVRAWGTIYIAQSRGVAFAAGFDHIVYGWIFFAIVMTVLLVIAWRFSDRPADEPWLDAEALQSSDVLDRLARQSMAGWPATIAIVMIAAAAAAWGVALARPLAKALLAAAGLHP
ncbi:MAG: exosortase A [Croceibacterium sp.]